MGSVRDLYVTGDNDPEVFPEAYYRHYAYCDACGSFDLEPWTTPENHAELEAKRRRLGLWALLLLPLVAVVAWLALGLFPPPSLVAYLVIGIVAAVLVRVYWFNRDQPGVIQAWHFVGCGLLCLVAILVVEAFVGVLLPRWPTFVAGLAVIVALVLWRSALGSKIDVVGLRCRACGTTYAYGTPFFTDLDANPRHLIVDDVPRPLGSSIVWRGASAELPPAKPRSRLPS